MEDSDPERHTGANAHPSEGVPPRVGYHLGELETALDPDDPYHSLPDFSTAWRVLDVGCGIGQTLLTAPGRAEALRVGIDVDVDCLAYGAAHHSGPRLVGARAEDMPFADAAFDAISSRVALPYTDLPAALDEIARVLAPGGRVWMTFHTAAFVRRQWIEALRARRAKDLAFRSYVLLNGLCLHLAGRTFRLPGTHRTESFQSVARLRRLLEERAFESIDLRTTRTGSLLATACAPEGFRVDGSRPRAPLGRGDRPSNPPQT